ncbi:MAG: tRNA (adenosine(37)-N6)-threonylcarbamoyltransferase complex dimerization subunit type 1 TsaB [Acidobacteria bacterium]|nr:tRNA (adenosine(37)-N6)-threonylcarbamoyltransferase complex dimerization subunit type 1 TsaB [Acidobacteriota bacterium]
MIVLALDTTTPGGSVALLGDERADVSAGDPRVTHGQRLPAELKQILGRNHVSLAEVDLFAVAAGPGSFTGLRVGIATIQGLALVNRRPVVAVSALDALTRLAADETAVQEGDLIAAWMDAQRGEVFALLNRLDVRGGHSPPDLHQVEAPTVGRPDATLQRWQALRDRRTCFIGGGALMHRDVILSAGHEPVVIDRLLILAPIIARMAAELAVTGRAIQPHQIRPVYVRRPDAELARGRRR